MKNLLFILILVLPLCVKGQIEPAISGEENSFAQLWKLGITHLDARNPDAYLRIQIRDSRTSVVYEGRSRIVLLRTGFQELQPASFAPINESINRIDLNNPPAGNYQVVYRLIRPGDFKELGKEIIQVQIKGNPNAISNSRSAQPATANGKQQSTTPIQISQQKIESPKIKGGSNLIGFSGDGRIYGHYASRQGTNSQIPTNYVRAELFPTLTIGQIPIGANILLSTEQASQRQSINQISFNFDAQQFQQNLKDKLNQRLSDLEFGSNLENALAVKNFKEQLIKKRFPDIDKWRQELSNPDLQKKLQEVSQLDNLKEIVKHETFSKAAQELKEYQELYNVNSLADLEQLSAKMEEGTYLELKSLLSYRDEFKRLQARKQELEKLAKSVEKYKDIAKKLAQAEKIKTASLLSNSKDFKKGLKQFGLNNGPTKFFSSIENLGVGTSYPFYTPQTMNGISVNGVNLELNPGGVLYLAGTFGKSARETLDTTFSRSQYTFSQQLMGLRAGFGSPYKSHIHFTYLNIKDESESPFRDSLNNRLIYPQENDVLGTDFKIALFQQKFVVGGEINGSIYNRNRLSDTLLVNPFANDSIPLQNFIEKRLNNSSAVDFAYRGYLRVRLFKSKTQLNADISQVGPGYTSLAAPTLLKDLLRWRMEFKQKLFKNALQLSAFARRDENQLTQSSSLIRNEVTSIGGNLRLQIPKLPYLIATYAPYEQNNFNEATQDSLKHQSKMLNLILGHSYTLGEKVQGFTQLNYMRQDFQTDIPNGSYENTLYGLTQNLTFGRFFSLNISGTYQPEFQIGNQTTSIKTLDISGAATLLKKWQNSFGVQFLEQDPIDQRTGFYWTSSYPIAPFATLQTRLQRNIYDDILDVNGYRELVGYIVLNLRW